MSRRFPAFLPAFFSLALMLPLSAQAEEFRVEAKLKAATVYADRAMLTGKAEVTMTPGKHTVIFENLPIALFPDSLRVEGGGTASAVLGAVSHKQVNNAELVSATERELNGRLIGLQNQQKAVTAEKAALAAKSVFLESLKAQAVQKTNEEVAEFNLHSEQWLSAAEAVHTGIAETLKADLEKDMQLEGIAKQIEKTLADLNQLQTGQKQTYEVRLPIEVTKGGNLNIDLSYQLPGASWRPIYDARLNTETGALEITQYGSVTQKTGTDWSGIALTLSTARPHRGATLPPLGSIWIDFMQQYPAAARMSVEMMDADIAQNMGSSALPVPVDAPKGRLETSAATIDTSGFTAEYIIPGPSTVPADGTENKVLIGTFKTENRMETHIHPQTGSDAYLVARATLKGEAPILPGTVSLFRDGSYVGQSQFPLLRPDKSYDLSFGIDDQIEMQHKPLKDEKSEGGLLIGKTNSIERDYVTEIQNLRGRDTDIVVMQAVPVARNEDIKVAVLPEQTTPGYKSDYENVKGAMRWAFTLKPQEKKDIKLGWSVTWPKDMSISGLPPQ